jgi:hypothetical protein
LVDAFKRAFSAFEMGKNKTPLFFLSMLNGGLRGDISAKGASLLLIGCPKLGKRQKKVKI